MRTLLLTHHHHDHVAEAFVWRDAEVLAHPIEAEQLEGVDRTIEPGETLDVGGLHVETLHSPGHTAGMLNFLINGTDVFTGDTLFKGSVGGVRAPGSTSFADLRHSIMDVLMELPHETRVQPGHTEPTTIGDEWEQQRLRAPLARPRRGRRGDLPRLGQGRDARAVGAGLRRRSQGLGALARRERRHRPGQPGPAHLSR